MKPRDHLQPLWPCSCADFAVLLSRRRDTLQGEGKKLRWLRASPSPHRMGRGDSRRSALVHFLSSLNTANISSSVGADQFKMQEGRRLYHQVGCVACHAPQEPASSFQAKSASGERPVQPSQSTSAFLELKNSSVPLGNLAQKTTVEQLAKFLLDPL